MAAKYFVEVPRGPVFQRMHESERQALMNMPMPAAASLTALATARHRALGQLGIDVRKQGVGNHARLRLYASTEVHSSIQKAVELLGLGSDSIRWIEVDEDFRLSLDHLRRRCVRTASEGGIRFV
jgi:glutamate/tyrosine decarboxylase-like PLP-dependent enzyme